MGFIGDAVSSIFGGGSNEPAQQAAQQSTQAAATQAGATTDAAEIAAQSQRESLEYLKEREQVPQAAREAAITRLSGVSGLIKDQPRAEIEQAEIDRITASPLYAALISGGDAGEEAILRNASATGGLRSGNVQENLYDYNTQLQNRSMLGLYNQQMNRLQGLAGLPSLAPMIAEQTAGVGQTLASGRLGAGTATAQGQVAAGQAYQQGASANSQNLLGLGALGLSAYSMFSDRRLKTNIKKIGYFMGQNIYSFAWNPIAQKMGLTGKTVGVMADEVLKKAPEAVSLRNHFLLVDYSRLGILPEILKEAA